MFTGIVEEIGTINNLVNSVLTIQAEKVLTDIKLGGQHCSQWNLLNSGQFH
ncbi:MAG: hypothetical protein Ct9H300mP27_04520 [Chloroflexota bacterium]|nr:MAG: hypothetical protein Ct9H300mP27_04520 [Chloroflexota bacterium]